MSDLKKEFKDFLDDIEKNIKNPEDLQYIKGRVTDLFGVLLTEMDRVINFKEEKISILMERQQKIDAKMNNMEIIMNNIERDIYSDEGFDFEIVCPYCNHEFVTDFDENQIEITCPECNNTIELDWSGDTEGDCDNYGCSSCLGCQSQLEENEEDDM